MEMILSVALAILAFLVIFSVLVLVHEWGHFFVARKAGIKVEEFGFGLPPRVWGIKKGETLYSLNAIPFGGFVRLLGEDAKDPKILKDKRSFAGKPAWVRIAVVVAGVVMNFVLAWGLLTVGFTFGIQPLIVSGDDVLRAIDEGTIEVQYGSAEMGSEPAAPGNVAPAGSAGDADAGEADVNTLGDTDAPPAQTLLLPHLKVGEVKNMFSSVYAEVLALPPLLPGDVILEVYGQKVYFWEDLLEVEEKIRNFEFPVESVPVLLLRKNAEGVTEVVEEHWVLQEAGVQSESTQESAGTVGGANSVGAGLVVSEVMPNTPAAAAGIHEGDVILSLEGKEIQSLESFAAIMKEVHAGSSGDDGTNRMLQYEIRQNGRQVEMLIQPNEQGLLGVGLVVPHAAFGGQVMVYSDVAEASVVAVHDVQYPVWVAPVKALEEAARLSVFTVQMLGGVVQSLVTQFAVPQEVAGPLGIAQMTHTFVQEGFLSLIRFTALLSLSLAIMNILPFPALDGGRLFFILVEVVTRRKISPKFEAAVHAIGFLLLMALIVLVTWNDILRFFI